MLSVRKRAAVAAAVVICIWRLTSMTRSTMSIVRGAGIGMALGMAAGIAGGCALAGKKRTMRRRARHAAHMMTDLLDNAAYIFK